jgi:5-methylcytosine-specific restriction endonuclease McrBC regulatory subunit McrC
MKLQPLYDNECIDDEIVNHPIISSLANKSISTLDKEKFIIFPYQLNESKDLDDESMIFQSRNGKTWTCNIVGILSDSKDELQINSRFCNKKNHEDYFLRYMIQTVLNYNIVNSDLNSSMDFSYYDLLVFLFPYYLNEAMHKGLYKEYVQKEYNDINIKGIIDIAKQVKNNTPFVGNVAYRTREFSYDNNLTQLIRHTIEKIQVEYDFLLSSNDDIIENIRVIKNTTNNYSRLNRFGILQNNILNPVKHGYFEEYSLLQRLCIQILSDQKSGFGLENNHLHGIIIDVAWLWEEYIWKITKWKHYGRNNDLLTMQLFNQQNGTHRYPDFVVNNIPVDTKYKKRLDTRNDYNQLTTYIHIMNKDLNPKIKGGFLQPISDKEIIKHGYQKLGMLNGLGGELFSYKFFIPQDSENYLDFTNQIHKVEEALKNTIFG